MSLSLLPPMSVDTDIYIHTKKQTYNIEFRSKVDEGWYNSDIIVQNDTIVVKLLEFPDNMDEKFEVGDFVTFADVEEFLLRFRPLSEQLQDDQCGRVVEGITVCASYSFSVDDIRYYDAIVDSVHRKEHSFGKDEECRCRFILYWLHGPKEGLLSGAGVANICMIEPVEEIDSRLASFSKMAKEKIEHSVMSGSGFVGKASSPENGTIPSPTKKCSRSSQLTIQVKQDDKQFPHPLGRKEEAGRISKHYDFQDIDFTRSGRTSKCTMNNLQDIGGSCSAGKDISSSSIGVTAKQHSTLSRARVQVKEENGQFLGSSRRKEEGITGCPENNLQLIDFGGLSRPRINSSSLVMEASGLCSSLNPNNLQVNKVGRVGRQFLSQAGRTEGFTTSGLSRHEEPESRHFILVDNLEKDLSSSSIVKFLQDNTSTSPQACVFPSLSSESYTRGVIEIDSEKKLKQISKYLNNPDHIVTSSKGRPWVIHEEPPRCKTFETTIGGVTSILQEKITVEELKVVHRGGREYKAAKRKRDLFLEFAEHQKGLHKKLALEEKKIS